MTNKELKKRIDEILNDLWYMGNRHDREIDVSKAKQEIQKLIDEAVKAENRSWEKFLPSEEETENIIIDTVDKVNKEELAGKGLFEITVRVYFRAIAKAIAKRIGKETQNE